MLLVGHEPDFSRAVAMATGSRVKFRKGGIAAFDDHLLHALLPAKDLRRIAGGYARRLGLGQTLRLVLAQEALEQAAVALLVVEDGDDHVIGHGVDLSVISTIRV